MILVSMIFTLSFFRYLWVCDGGVHTNFKTAYFKGIFVLGSYLFIYVS